MVAYCILGIYLFCVIGEYLNVNWRDPALPQAYINPEFKLKNGLSKRAEAPLRSQAIIVIAALRANHRNIAGFLNGCIMLSALSASNTSLYVASRVLYGMTRKINKFSKLGFLRPLGSVWHRTGVPVRALVASFAAFVWLPFLKLKAGVATDVRTPPWKYNAYSPIPAFRHREHFSKCMLPTCMGFTLSRFYSISPVVCGPLICNKSNFISNMSRFSKHKAYIKRRYPEHDRLSVTSQSTTLLAQIQPLPAYIGMIGSLLIVLVFTTATWWSTQPTFKKVAVAYGAVSCRSQRPVVRSDR